MKYHNSKIIMARDQNDGEEDNESDHNEYSSDYDEYSDNGSVVEYDSASDLNHLYDDIMARKGNHPDLTSLPYMLDRSLISTHLMSLISAHLTGAGLA
jgi:hypothetical protein